MVTRTRLNVALYVLVHWLSLITAVISFFWFHRNSIYVRNLDSAVFILGM
jgi:hypothetical protein